MLSDSSVTLFMGMWCVLVFAVLLPLASPAAVYYVDQNNPKAFDSNAGTEERPWKTPYAWIDKVVAGDTVLVKAGTYKVVQGGSWSTPALNPKNEGKLGSPITFKAHPGHRVVLEGDNGSATIGSNNRDYIVVDGFTVSRGHIAVFGAPSSRLKGIVIQNNIIREKFCDLAQTGNCEAIRLEHVSGAKAVNNLMFNVYNRQRDHNSAGFKLYHVDNTIIENNEIYDTNQGVFLKVDADDNIVRYNYIRDTARGIGIWAGIKHVHSNNRVYGNIIAHSKIHGMYIAGTPQSNVGTKIYNNTVVKAASAAYAIESDIRDVQVWNNIAYDSPKSGIDANTNPPFSYCDHNLYYLTTRGCGASSLRTDPRFVSAFMRSPGDFKLQAQSPAREAGRNGEDIGAYATGREVIGLP